MEAIGFDVSTSVVTNRVRVNVQQIRSRALATLARRLPVQARRDIQQEYNLKAARIRDGLSIRRPDDGSVILRGAARGINLIAFGARWNRRKGVTARVLKSGKATVRPHAFIAAGRNGNTLVFERRGKKRLPLDALYGPSIGQMLKHRDRPQRLADYASGIVAAEIARQTR
jgi:hypothetical protein